MSDDAPKAGGLAENEFTCRVEIRVPQYGSKEHTKLLHWMNKQHCGFHVPPDDVSEAHLDASYKMQRSMYVSVRCELNKDGTVTVKSLERK